MAEQGRALVTGAAGFIGSHLAEALLDAGHPVVGVDCFTDYYPRAAKERNLEALRRDPAFTFQEADLRTANADRLLEGVDYVFHQAGQPGVRGSWGTNFQSYADLNILVTQRLLEAARHGKLKRFVYASSSSVYGNAPALPARETTLPQPVSPYGVTKLAAEHLCGLYAQNFGVPTVSLRYFTVYGPRQRPDMAFHRFIRALLTGQEVRVHGDGEQTRDFTFIADAIRANLAARSEGGSGAVYNVGGGARVTVNAVLRLLEAMTGKTARVVYRPAEPGDARHTLADTSAARTELGFEPRCRLEDGLRAEVAWLEAARARERRARAA